MSDVPRNGSAISSSAGSVDNSSHNHIFSHLRSTAWLHEVWLPYNHRHERISMGTMRSGMAVMTREMLEMHIQSTPDVRGMLDYLPVAGRSNTAFIGWRQKLGTWPSSKQHPIARRFE